MSVSPQSAHPVRRAAPPPVAVPARPEPMTSVDRAWFEMDDPRNPMVVASIMEFDGVRSPDKLGREMVAHLARQPRFRQRICEMGEGLCWVEDDELHAGYHARQQVLRRPASETALREAIGQELGHPLDRALPLWRIVLFPRGAGRVTVLFRAHHAIADGIALMQLMLQMGNGHAVAAAAPRRNRRTRHGPLGGVIRRLENVNHLLEALGEVVADDLRHPDHLAAQLRELRSTLGAVARVTTLPDDNPRCLRAPLSGRRAVAWNGDLSLEAVRQVARAQDVTINDVFLTALAGAFGHYLRAAGERVPEQQNLRVSVPVNLRAKDDASTSGNSFGLVLVDLPVGLEGWHARLDVIAERMAALKKSPEARATLLALAAAGYLPLAAEKSLVNLVGGKAAAVVSNLPGPRRALKFDGARLANVVFWPPQASRVGVGVSLLSYAGRVTVGISADTAVIARPGEVIDRFCDELAAMYGRSPFLRRAGSRRPSPHPSTARSAKGAHHGKA